ncbi:MAG: hypothetical protein HYU67_10995 [Flavobacteriia bacterium]|nr:hypothetical protein [Flavobacteriia bacterium]
MKKYYLLVLILATISIYSQDVLRFNNGKVDTVKITEINKTEIKYKKFTNLNGPDFICLKEEVTSIQYSNGQVENIYQESLGLNDEEFIKSVAIKDSKKYYRGYRKGIGITIGSCIVMTPIGGIFVAKKYSNKEITNSDLPKIIKRRGYNGTEFIENPYYENEIYQEKFKSCAKVVQKRKIWNAYAGGNLITLGIAGVTTFIIVIINELNY